MMVFIVAILDSALTRMLESFYLGLVGKTTLSGRLTSFPRLVTTRGCSVYALGFCGSIILSWIVLVVCFGVEFFNSQDM